jgi:hypothetical protein
MIKKFNEYLKESEVTLTQEQKDWLDECTKGSWRLNPSTGLVDLNGDFDCSNYDLTNFKGVKFGESSRNFSCSFSSLTSLEGAPKKVLGYFTCAFNNLSSLEGSPREIGDDFFCASNFITSLEGAPEKIGGNFACQVNKITSLEGMPFVEGSIDIDRNPIWNFISPYWSEIQQLSIKNRSLVLEMLSLIKSPSKEEVERIISALKRMDIF